MDLLLRGSSKIASFMGGEEREDCAGGGELYPYLSLTKRGGKCSMVSLTGTEGGEEKKEGGQSLASSP